MSTARKSGYHHGDLRRALIESAIAFLENHDASELSLRGIAKLAGVSTAAPYHHFSSKEDVLLAVANTGFISLTDYMRPAVRRVSPDKPTRRLQVAAMKYLEFAWDNPGQYSAMFRNRLVDPASEEQLKSAALRSFQQMVRNVQAALKEHGRRQDPTIVAYTIWSALHGLARLRSDGVRSSDMTRDAYLAIARRITSTIPYWITGRP